MSDSTQELATFETRQARMSKKQRHTYGEVTDRDTQPRRSKRSRLQQVKRVSRAALKAKFL